MKKLLYASSALLALASLTACDSFLEEDPKGQFMQQSYFTKVDDFEGILPDLCYEAASFYYDGRSLNMSVRSDDITALHKNAKTLEKFNIPADEQYLADHWEQSYLIIQRANTIIMNMDRCKEGDMALLNKIAGIAYFYRGWSYLNIARFFKHAPIMEKITGDYDSPSRSQKALFEQAVADFQMAEGLLPDNWNGTRYEKEAPIKLTAKAAMAETYLIMAGYPLKLGTEYYNKAAAKAKEVIDGAPAQGRGFDSYDAMWNTNDPNSNVHKERLLCYYFTTYSRQSALPTCMLPDIYSGWTWMGAERTFYRDMPEGPRKKATYIDTYSYYPEVVEQANAQYGTNYDPAAIPFDCPIWAASGLTISPTIRKHCLVHEAQMQGCEDKMYLIDGWRFSILLTPLRYTQTALTYAEACARTGQSMNQAYELLDYMRQRAGLEPFDRSLSGDALAAAIVQERGWELAGEWTRYSDLCRLEMVEEVFKRRAEDEPNFNSNLGTPSHEYYYLPVPADELVLNPNLDTVVD